MSKEAVGGSQPGGAYSPGIIAEGRFVYVAGQTPTRDGVVTGETTGEQTAKRAGAEQLWARPRFADERDLGRIAQRGAQRMVRAQSRAWIRAGGGGPRHFPTEL